MIEACTKAYESTEEGTNSAWGVKILGVIMVKLTDEACLDISVADKGENGIPCESVEALECISFFLSFFS